MIKGQYVFMEKTGIVVLNYQTWKLSLRCMESIRRTCRGLRYQIYLVDNASSRPMPDVVRRYISADKGIRFLKAEKNQGYAAGNNIGIAKALEDGCSMIVVANNDIVFQSHSVAKMADCLTSHSGVGIVGPKVVDGRGRIQASRCSMKTGIREIFQLYTAAKWAFRRKWKAYHCLEQDPDMPADVYHVSGCCFAFSRECAQKIAPLDEGTLLYYEEPILGIRMEQAGYRTRYEPGSVVVHQHGGTTRRVRPFMYQCISQSELYYCARYLHAEVWQLWILYHYRRMLYWMHCITDREMRRGLKTFQEKTGMFYREMIRQKRAGCYTNSAGQMLSEWY